MSGSLALVGSGEFLPAMANFERELLNDGLSNGMKPAYVQIPTAAGQESEDRLAYWKELGRKQADLLGIEQRFLPIFTREDAFNPKYVEMIHESALMYMSGGDPHYLAETLIDTPAWEAIVKNWTEGASLAGCSAGAMVLSSYVPNFRFLNRESTPGLSLLPNIRVIPHFDKFFRWIPESAAKILMHAPENSILIGIDELTAMVRRKGDESWLVYGRAKVHILSGMPAAQYVDGETFQSPPSGLN